MQLEAGMPDFVKLLIQHRPKALRGQSLIEAMQVDRYQPRRLAAHYERWRTTPEQLYRASPSLVFAVIGQAKMHGKISPEAESNILARLLTHWALRRTLEASATHASRSNKLAAVPVI
jgi:hypothetical protein